jgi:hypothetical protein
MVHIVKLADGAVAGGRIWAYTREPTRRIDSGV